MDSSTQASTSVRFSGALTSQTIERVTVRAVPQLRNMAIALLVLSLFSIAEWLFGPRDLVSGWHFSVAMFVAGVVLLFFPKLSAKRALKSNRLLQQTVSGVISDDGVQLTTQYSDTHLSWSVFHHQTSDPDLVLLFISPSQAHAFPRAYFESTDDWDAFRALAANKVKLRKQTSPFRRAILFAIIGAIVFLLFLFSSHPTPPNGQRERSATSGE